MTASVAAPDYVSQFVLAVDALFVSQETDPQRHAAANRWLTDFQRTPAAWNVADRVLHTSGLSPPMYYTAANTLLYKLQHDYADLSKPQDRSALRQSLLLHMIHFTDAPQHIRTRLAMCLADLTVRLVAAGEWANAVEQLANQLTAPAILVDTMSELVYECAESRFIDGADRSIALRHFSSAAVSWLNKLSSILATSGNHQQLHIKIFECYAAWLTHVPMPVDVVVSHSMSAAVFDAFAVAELTRVSGECIVELSRMTHRASVDAEIAMKNKGITEDAGAQIIHEAERYGQIIVEKVLSFHHLLSAEMNSAMQQANINDERAWTFCRVFVHVGENNLAFVVDGSQTALRLLDCITLCASHPATEISANTFNFFFVLSDQLYQIARKNAEEGAHRRAVFAPYYQRFIFCVSRVMRYPDDVTSWSKDDDREDSSRRYRYYAGDALVDSCSVLGAHEVLVLIANLMQKAIQQTQNSGGRDWQTVESLLYCIRCIGHKIECDENTVMPSIMNALPLMHQIVPAASGHGHYSPRHLLSYTAILIVGRYAVWIEHHPETLPALLSYVVNSLNDKSLQSAAALAFKNVCDFCRSLLSTNEMITALFAVYHGSTQLHINDAEEIIEGMVCVVASVDESILRDSIRALIQHITDDIQRHLSRSGTQEPTSNGSAVGKGREAVDAIYNGLTRLSHLMLCLQKNTVDATSTSLLAATVVDAIADMWPLTTQIVSVYARDELKMERLIKMWKWAARAAKQPFAKLLHQIVALVATTFQEVQQSYDAHDKHTADCFLYLIASLIDDRIFSNLKEFVPLFSNALNAVTPLALSLLTSPNIPDYPDVAECFFDMAMRYCKYFPDVIMTSAHLEPITQRAIAAMKVAHEYTATAATAFITALIADCVDAQKFNVRRQSHPIATRLPFVHKILANYGAAIISTLIAVVAGPFGVERAETTVACWEVMILAAPSHVGGWLEAALIPLVRTAAIPANDVEALIQCLITSRAWETAQAGAQNSSAVTATANDSRSASGRRLGSGSFAKTDKFPLHIKTGLNIFAQAARRAKEIHESELAGEII